MQSQDSERLVMAIHALNGTWIDGGTAAALLEHSLPRDELLAKGIVDLGWLDANLPAKHEFAALVGAALAGFAGEDETVPPPVTTNPTLGRDEALSLAARFSDNPDSADPMDALRRMTIARSQS